ncbi:MAG: thiol peroxidase [Bacillota bacterium]|nr:thiol peroxidase [Bacillota bacterium]MDW7676255.1 thiol peroxidase [Bacillota bacterium]
MEKRKGMVTIKGNPVTLIGSPVKVGAPAPEFAALTRAMQPFRLSDVKGKKVLISVAHSVDTGVCDLQTARFNEEAAKLANSVVVSISMDLPFALKRYCADRGIENSIVLSDHKDADFGLKYGFLIEELRLLARGLVVIDEKGIVRYVEVVPEVSEHPDYDQALSVLNQEEEMK